MSSIPPFSESIWNSAETQPREYQLASLIPKLLGVQLSYVLKYSPFYRTKLSGLALPGVDDMAAFHDSLPLTSKSEIMDDQKSIPPFGSNLCAPEVRLRRISRTSGSTGAPMILALTENDIRNTYECGARCFYSSGLRPHHTVINCMNYCMWAGGYTDHGSMETVGATVIPFGVGNSKTLIEMMLRIRPHALHSTPSYLVRLRDVLRQEFGKDPGELGLQLGLFGGEGGLQDRAYRSKIDEEWGFRSMNANYGMSDVLSMFGAECEMRDGLHFMGQNVIYPTLLDPVSSRVIPIEKGAFGELVVTNLLKEAQPLIRYRTGDLIEIVSVAGCACGRESFKFQVAGRSDDMIVVKGINVFVGAIGKVINSFLDVLNGQYVVYTDRGDPVQRIVVRAEVKPGCPDSSALSLRIQRALTHILSVRPDVELVEEGVLPRADDKTKRLQRVL